MSDRVKPKAKAISRSAAAHHPRAEETRGSITPLIFTYFTVTIILIFIVSNVAATYVARRELTNRVESSMLRAAQELDQLRYYYGGPNTEFLAHLAKNEGKLVVPIDCSAAGQTFRSTLSMHSSNYSAENSPQNSPADSAENSPQNSPAHSTPTSKSSITNSDPRRGAARNNWRPEIHSFSCDGSRISAIVTERLELPFRIPVLGIKTFENRVEVSADSVYR